MSSELSDGPKPVSSEPGPVAELQNVTECYTSGGEGAASVALSDVQLQALDLLLLGWSDAGVARKLSLSRMTLWRWKTQDAAFGRELDRRRRQLWNSAGDRYRRLLLKAAKVLQDHLEDGEQTTSLRAAYAILQMSGRFQPVDEARGALGAGKES